MTEHTLPLESLLWAMLHPRASRIAAGHVKAGPRELARASTLLAHPGGPLIPFAIPKAQMPGLRLALAQFLATAPPNAEAWIQSHAALAGMGHLRIRKDGETTFVEKAMDLKTPPWLLFDSRAIERRLRLAQPPPMTATLAPDPCGLVIQIHCGTAQLKRGDECSLQALNEGPLRGPLSSLIPLKEGRILGDTVDLCFQTSRPEQTLRLSALAEDGEVLALLGGPRQYPRMMGAIRLRDVQDTPLDLRCAEFLPTLPWEGVLTVGKGLEVPVQEHDILALGASLGWLGSFWKVPVVKQSLVEPAEELEIS